MASKKVTMYAEKRYELEQIKNGIQEEFNKKKSLLPGFWDVEFKDEVSYELGETKTLLLVFERWYMRTESYASLIILLSEYKGFQSADIIATGGIESFTSWGAEKDFAKRGEDALRSLGFESKRE